MTKMIFQPNYKKSRKKVKKAPSKRDSNKRYRKRYKKEIQKKNQTVRSLYFQEKFNAIFSSEMKSDKCCRHQRHFLIARKLMDENRCTVDQNVRKSLKLTSGWVSTSKKILPSPYFTKTPFFYRKMSFLGHYERNFSIQEHHSSKTVLNHFFESFWYVKHHFPIVGISILMF